MSQKKCVWPLEGKGSRCKAEGTEPVFNGSVFYRACKEHHAAAQEWVNKKRAEMFAQEEKDRQEMARLTQQAQEEVIKRLTRGDAKLARFAASFMFCYHGVTAQDVRTLARGKTPSSR